MSCRLAFLCLAAVSAWGQVTGHTPPTRVLYDTPRLQGTVSEEDFLNQTGFEMRSQSPPATVSADQLRYQVSRKGAKMIEQALRHSRAGEHTKAIADLQLALHEPSAAPYAHSLLGSEYLRIGQVPAAVKELEQAVRLLPHDVANHSNLGYALYLGGQKDRGKQEVRQALALDSHNPQTRYVLGIVGEAPPAAK